MAAASLLSIIRWKRRGLNLSSVCPAAAPATGWTWSCAALPPICAAKWSGKSARRVFQAATLSNDWRRERDSNPERALTLTPLAGVRLRPLGHLSAPWETLVSACLAGGEPGWPASGAAMILKRPTRSKAPQRSPTSGAEPRAHEFLHRLERRIERLRIAAAGLRKIRPTSAASAHLRRHRTGQLARLDARGLIGAHPCDQQHLGRVLDARQHHARRFEAVLQLIDGGAQRAGIRAVHPGGDDLDAAHVDGAGGQVHSLTGREPVLERAILTLHLSRPLELLAHLVLQVLARAAHEGCQVLQQGIVLFDVVERSLARERLDAAHAGGDAALAHDLEKPDVPGALHVRAAAQLHRELAHAQHPHVLVVLLAKQRDGARAPRALVVHDARFRGDVGADLRVHEPFDLAQLRGRERLEMREIEAQPVGRHQRSFLLYVGAEYLAQRRVQQMRGAVIERRRLAPGAVHVSLEGVADTNAALLDVTRVRMRGAALVRVSHYEAHIGTGELARIPHLTARLGVERRAVEHDLTLLTRAERVDLRALLQQRDHTAGAGQPLVALEQRVRVERGAAAQIHAELARFLGTAPLFLHRRFKARLVDFQAALARHVGRQVDRKAIGVVQLEHGVAIDHLRALQVANGALEQHHAVGERLRET